MIKNILIGTALVLVMVASAGATVVRVDPPSQTIIPGTDFQVNITVEGVVDGMRAYDVVLNFDHSAMQVKKTCGVSGNEFCIIQGAFLQAGGSTLWIPPVVDPNIAGAVIIGNVLLGDYTPVTGDGILGTVKFDTDATASPGIYNLNLTGVILVADADGAVIPTDVLDGEVIIEGEPPITPVSVPVLSGIGMIVLTGMLAIVLAISVAKRRRE